MFTRKYNEYSVKKRLYCIAYENIMYFESCEKKVFIHRVKGEDIHFYGRLDQVNEETDEIGRASCRERVYVLV